LEEYNDDFSFEKETLLLRTFLWVASPNLSQGVQAGISPGDDANLPRLLSGSTARKRTTGDCAVMGIDSL
jgi:hypothetical protein